jgi:hypothetical protein
LYVNKKKTMTDDPPRKKARSALLTKVISGGQTGADVAALQAAKACNLETGGAAPTGYLTTTGANFLLRDEFGLEELRVGRYVPLSAIYALRSQRNVDAADATVAFRLLPSTGTDKTIGYCQTGSWRKATNHVILTPHRRCLVIRDVGDTEAAAALVVAFVQKEQIATLNVCGHRDDITAGVAEFQSKVAAILELAFTKLQSKQ